MVLSLAAVTLLLAASEAAAMPGRSVEGICSNKKKAYTTSGHEWVACGEGKCDGEKGACEGGDKSWISFSFVSEERKDTPECQDSAAACAICKDECVSTSGASSAAAKNPKHGGGGGASDDSKDVGTASDSDSVAVPKDTEDASASASEDGDAGDATTTASGDGMSSDDNEDKDGGDDVATGGAGGDADGEDKADGGDMTDGGMDNGLGGGDDDETVEDDAVVMEDGAAGGDGDGDKPDGVGMAETGAEADGADDADTDTEGPAGAAAACITIVDALLGLDFAGATAIATVAGKALDPVTAAALLDPAANLTVFVPPEEAILKLVGGLEAGALSLEDVGAILKLHLVPEPLSSEMLIEMEGDALPTLLGEDDMLLVGLEGEAVSLSASANSTVLVTDVDIDGCSDSQVIHRIDGLLIPEGMDIDLDALEAGTLTDVEALPPAAGEGAVTDPGAGVESGAAAPAGGRGGEGRRRHGRWRHEAPRRSA